eukprot:scaffold141789_cov32-Tisochrysis_lutea.AAC.8
MREGEPKVEQSRGRRGLCAEPGVCGLHEPCLPHTSLELLAPAQQADRARPSRGGGGHGDDLPPLGPPNITYF